MTIDFQQKQPKEGGVTALSWALGPARPPSDPFPFLTHRTVLELREAAKREAST